MLLLVLVTLGLTSCATHRIEDDFIQLREDGAIVVPVSFTDDGGMLIDVLVDGEGPYPFLVDTGSTTSAIFNDARARLGIDVIPGRQVQVRGIVGTAMRPVIRVGSIDIGPIREEDKLLVVLDSRRQNAGETASGLIGLDILGDFALAWYPEERSFYFIPHRSLVPYVETGWIEVPLRRDPYGAGLEELYFADVEIDGRTIPGLVDLGSAFTLMNWADIQHPSLQERRRMLRRDWQLQGAVDEFLPTVASIYPVLRIGDYAYYDHMVLVHEFDSANISGAAGQPLFIAGASMFAGHDFIMDFAGQKLYLSRSTMDRPNRSTTGTRLRSYATESYNVKSFRWND
ncbi:hypothetical protein GCM10011342_07840 [Aquisalinus flavus]|uniref:Aspartyl protease n=1 Tax=Aquisalinus flavus TaxID=1526572 RepID=A0A8J2V166_9PROT|nr:hypothetical protein GCM10011342_07840 [Aquisalinus flavus]